MNFGNLLKLYEKKKQEQGLDTYKYISLILKEAKELHKKDFMKKPTAMADHEQSWRAFKGKNLEKLIVHIIKDEVEILGLRIVEGTALERTNSKNLSEELNKVKRNLLVDYGEFGHHLPDVDIIIYNPKKFNIIAVLSSKVTLWERIAQTSYWKFKLLQDQVTRHIRVYFITPDEDGTLTIKKPSKKGRAIVEVDTDGSYVLSETEIEESEKVKMFDKFIVDLKNLLNDYEK